MLDFGPAVSRVLSAPLPGERIICLSDPTRNPVPRDAERAAPGSPIWSCTRWGLPCPRDYSWGGGLLPHLFTLTRPKPGGLFSAALSVGTPRGVVSRVYPGPDPGYAASCPMVFGLSSPAWPRPAGAILHRSEIERREHNAGRRLRQGIADGKSRNRGPRFFRCAAKLERQGRPGSE